MTDFNSYFSQRPDESDCSPGHLEFVKKVPDGNILDILRRQRDDGPRFVAGLEGPELDVIHPPYGWTIRTVIEHCNFAERVFGYRMLRLASGDHIPLPGWDENEYARCGISNSPSIRNLAEEFAALRAANVLLAERLTPEAWRRVGEANGQKSSPRVQAWLMAAHWIHHLTIVRQRLGMSG